MAFYWNEEKNNQLKEERFISFERIVVAVEEDHLIDVIENPNKEKYRNKLILIVDIDGYAVCVPCVQQENGDYFLKTLFPGRKYTKEYNLGGKNE
ncbi:MAG: toxin [Spirochaetaceae bacterium]|nr:MAG: toxin [Spirochaetaceae bacterium]